jgi:hypothetical protein
MALLSSTFVAKLNRLLFLKAFTIGSRIQKLNTDGTLQANVTGNLTGNVTGPGYILLVTSDPHVSGALWNNSGTLTISAG